MLDPWKKPGSSWTGGLGVFLIEAAEALTEKGLQAIEAARLRGLGGILQSRSC
jgi:hypothetical protein